MSGVFRDDGRLSRNAIEESVAAINRRRSFGDDWSDRGRRRAVYVAVAWVVLVTIVCWGVKPDADNPFRNRASTAPVGALVQAALCLSLIWRSDGLYRGFGWFMLLFFILAPFVLVFLR